MGDFGQNLWPDLLDEHGSALATARRPAETATRSAVLTAAGAFGIVGLAAMVALAFTATGPGTPSASSADT